jgi:arginine/serine-rich splicing factor 17
LEEKFLDWKKHTVEKMDRMELNLEGFKYKLNVVVPAFDDFEAMRKAWEEFYAFGNRRSWILKRV